MISNEGCHDNDEGFFSRNYFSKTVQPLADLQANIKTHTQIQNKHRENIKVIHWNKISEINQVSPAQ